MHASVREPLSPPVPARRQAVAAVKLPHCLGPWPPARCSRRAQTTTSLPPPAVLLPLPLGYPTAASRPLPPARHFLSHCPPLAHHVAAAHCPCCLHLPPSPAPVAVAPLHQPLAHCPCCLPSAPSPAPVAVAPPHWPPTSGGALAAAAPGRASGLQLPQAPAWAAGEAGGKPSPPHPAGPAQPAGGPHGAAEQKGRQGAAAQPQLDTALTWP